MAVGLRWNGFSGPFQHKLFYDSVIYSLAAFGCCGLPLNVTGWMSLIFDFDQLWWGIRQTSAKQDWWSGVSAVTSATNYSKMWPPSKGLLQSGGQSLSDGDRSVPSKVFMVILQSVPASHLMLQSDPSCLLNFNHFYWWAIQGSKIQREQILLRAECPGLSKDRTMVLSFPLSPSPFSASPSFELLARERRENREKENKARKLNFSEAKQAMQAKYRQHLIRGDHK